jgi:methionyl-tRNA formyltransferase
MAIKSSRFLYIAYRDWAIKVYSEFEKDMPIAQTTTELLEHISYNHELEYLFFVGWSEVVPSQILKKFICLCIHPSMLPLYRGGSPLQNQIIDGVVDSGVTLFKLSERIDAGPIYSQKYLSLRGSLSEIFIEISVIASEQIKKFIHQVYNQESINFYEQNEKKATFYKRRRPEQSEISMKEIENSTALQLHNKIRALEDPYPNAFILCSDGRRLYLKQSEIQ